MSIYRLIYYKCLKFVDFVARVKVREPEDSCGAIEEERFEKVERSS